MFFCGEPVHHYSITQHRILEIFYDFARVFSLFSLVFRTSNFWSLRNLIKQSFHSRLLDMRLVIANSALRASLTIYHLISNARSWNYIITQVILAVWLVLAYDLVEDRRIDDDSARFKFFWILNLNQSHFFAKYSNQSVCFILYKH